MRTLLKTHMFVLVAAAMVLSACGAKAMPTPVKAPLGPADAGDRAPAAAATQPLLAMPTSAPLSQNAEAAGGVGEMDIAAASLNQGNRMIIKDAQITLLVADSDIAIDRTTQVISDVGGYIVSSRVWYQEWNGQNYKYSTITIGVPVDQFERTLSRLRGLSIRVLDEVATGEDVTNQYVDLESQLRNLEATRDRIRTFLDRAETVDDALKVNQQLSEIEKQIEEIKGRVNYLAGRSAYSTITVTIQPDLPQITPSPTLTPTPTSTPSPTPTPTSWKPGETLGDASGTLVKIYQWLINAAIWILIVVVPIFAPPVLLIWFIWWLVTRKRKKPAAGGGDKAG
jgi:hypothetical protein